MKIVSLIGPPGSGKSTVGKILADKLGWSFLDSDLFIEDQEKLSIPEIFEQFGELKFRQKESSLLEALEIRPAEFISADKNGLVLSTGGGMPCQEKNLQRLAKISEIISLNASLDILVTRVKTQSNRPLLADKAEPALSLEKTDLITNRLQNLIKQREDVYKLARYRIDTSELSSEQVADQIVRLLHLS